MPLMVQVLFEYLNFSQRTESETVSVVFSFVKQKVKLNLGCKQEICDT